MVRDSFSMDPAMSAEDIKDFEKVPNFYLAIYFLAHEVELMEWKAFLPSLFEILCFNFYLKLMFYP